MKHIIKFNIKKYILIAAGLSIVIHGLFFSIFKIEVKINNPPLIPGLNIISIEQFEYLKGVSRKVKDVISFTLPKSIVTKQPMWGDLINIIEDIAVSKTDVTVEDKNWLPEDSKTYNFRDMYVPLFYYEYITRDYYPSMDYLAQTESFQDAQQITNENMLTLDNGIKMKYYIQGPVSMRNISLGTGTHKRLNIDKPEVRAKLRLWVTKDGRINQVIVEEGSSFSLIDSEIVNIVKSWHFGPLYDINAPNYDWGIVSIRIQK